MPRSVKTCQAHGLVTVYFTFLYLNYGFSLSIEILSLSIRKKQLNSLFLHIFSNGLSLVLSAILLLTDSIGPSRVTVCFLSSSEWGVFSPFYAYVPFYVTSIVVSIQKRMSSWQTCYLGILLIQTFPLTILIIFGEENTWIEDLAIVLRSSQCLILTTLRLSELLNRRKKRLSESLLPPKTSITNENTSTLIELNSMWSTLGLHCMPLTS